MVYTPVEPLLTHLRHSTATNCRCDITVCLHASCHCLCATSVYTCATIATVPTRADLQNRCQDDDDADDAAVDGADYLRPVSAQIEIYDLAKSNAISSDPARLLRPLPAVEGYVADPGSVQQPVYV